MSEQPASRPQPQPQPQQRISIEVPAGVDAVYANAALIANTPAEILVDFVQVLPRMTKGQVKARVIMSPLNAKLFLQALAKNVATYEQQFGEIRIPTRGVSSIADEFFRFHSPGDDERE